MVVIIFINNDKMKKSYFVVYFFLLGVVYKINLTISLKETWKKKLTDNSTTEFKNYKDKIEELVSWL